MIVPIDMFANFLRDKNLKERSIENYVYYLNKYKHPKFNQEYVAKYLSESGNRNTASKGMITNLKKFLLLNKRYFNIDSDYFEEIVETQLPKVSGRARIRLIKSIPHEDVLSLEQYLETEKLKLMLLVTYYGGLRLGELLKIRIMSFNWKEWGEDPEKIGECIVLGKGDKEGIALLPSVVMKRIANFIKTGGFKSVNDTIFIKVTQKINIKNQSRIWQMRLRKAGIDAKISLIDENGDIVDGTSVHPHLLRHSWATHLLKDKNMDIRYIQEILRHSSIKSTQIYTHLDKEDLKKKLHEMG